MYIFTIKIHLNKQNKKKTCLKKSHLNDTIIIKYLHRTLNRRVRYAVAIEDRFGK